MGIRKKFNDRRIRKDNEKRAEISGELDALVSRLPEKIRSRQDLDRMIFFGPPSYDLRTFPAYRKLHEICAAADVQVSFKRIGLGASITNWITFRPAQSYESSTHAKFFKPKPDGVQLKLPGL